MTSPRSRPAARHRRPLVRRALAAVAVLSGLAASCAGDDTTTPSQAPATTSTLPIPAPSTTRIAGPAPTTSPATSATNAPTTSAPVAVRPPLPRPDPPATAAVDHRASTLPDPFEPVVWSDPPPRPALEGPLAVNDLLTGAPIVGEAELEGAEDVAPGLDGNLYTGTVDGAVWRLRVDATGAIASIEHVTTLPGRPLGLDAYSETTLVAAVPELGLMAIDLASGDSWVLADRIDGALVFFADAVAVAADGTIYVTEASTRYLPGFPNDFLDGRPNGRLLRYEPATGELTVVADGIHFANGVDVASDESYALVAESFRFRILRIWLGGDRAGTVEPFGEPLVNGPDNLRIDDRGRVWIGGSDLRSDATDALLTNADLRRAIAALSDEERAAARVPYGFAAVLDPAGQLLASFHDGTGHFSGVSSALVHGDTITFGTLNGRGVAQLAVPAELA